MKNKKLFLLFYFILQLKFVLLVKENSKNTSEPSVNKVENQTNSGNAQELNLDLSLAPPTVGPQRDETSKNIQGIDLNEPAKADRKHQDSGKGKAKAEENEQVAQIDLKKKQVLEIKGAAGPSTLPGGLGSSALGGTSSHIQRPQQPSLFKSFIQEFRNSNNQQQRPRSPQFQTYRPYFGQTNPLVNPNPSALPLALYELQHQQRRQNEIAQVIRNEPITSQVHSLNTVESSNIRPQINRNPTIPVTSAFNTANINPLPQLPFNQPSPYSIRNPHLAESKRQLLNNLLGPGLNTLASNIQQQQPPPRRPRLSEQVRGQIQPQHFLPQEFLRQQYRTGQFQPQPPQQSSQGSNSTPRNGTSENSSNNGNGDNGK
ncbi:unnamed protein product [Meloidogyne enterolobii]|uniref:Uncharacterized protein n=1 Tax=Meloidogyne enterolobii TaxID=390850 RepID=A0ACB1AUV9_MELEN